MLNFTNTNDLRGIIYTVGEILKADDESDLYQLVTSSEVSIDQTGYDNWNGGTYLFTIYLTVDVQSFVKHRDSIQAIENLIMDKINVVSPQLGNEVISSVKLIPKAQYQIDWSRLPHASSREKVINMIAEIKEILVSVSTGGQRIQDVNERYKVVYNSLNANLGTLNIKNPNPFTDLWNWYAKWSSEFKHYSERRAYISELFSTLEQLVQENESPKAISVMVDLTNWERIERSLNEIRIRQNEANNEEQYQVIGLLSRETIITLAQAVFIKDKHPILDGKDVSKTDAKRMLEAYIAVELGGSSNETTRRYAKATLDLANELTHKRTANKRDASLCATATISIINLIGTLEGRI